MKKIIDGALYNTDTAQELGSDEPNGYDRGNFEYFRETLYKTKSGKYFLHGEGHANSRYGVWFQNTGGWGAQIRPMSPHSAREWAEEHMNADEYMKLFGEVDEASDEREALNITIPADLKAALDRLKSEKSKSISQLITDAVREQYGI